MSNMNDVAQLSGVSVATVSNYINGTKPVKHDTRLKIADAIEKLCFQPSAAARCLKTNSSNDIGIVLPNIDDSYYIDIFKGIEKVFQHSDYYLNIAFSNEFPDIELKILESYLRKNICGVIVMTCQPNNFSYFQNNFLTKNIPVVFVDREISTLDANFVCFDNRKVIHRLTSKLLQNGYHKIGLMVGPKEYFCESQCIEGFINAFQDKNMIVNEQLISCTSLSKEDAFRSAISLLQHNKLDAIITSSKSISHGVLEAAYLRGISIPDDLLIITLGQEQWSNYSSLMGTFNTIRPSLKMGEVVAKLLQKNINSPVLFENERLVLEDKILYKDIIFTTHHKKEAPAKINKKTINVLLLECQSSHAIESLLPSFINNSSINVNIKTYQHQYLLNRIISDNQKEVDEIDVFMFDIPWLPSLASNGYLSDISAFIDSPDFSKDVFINDSFKNFSEFNDKYYGIPFMYGPQLLFYRKDLFTDKSLAAEFEKKYKTQLRPPRTWLEFNAIAEFFTKSGNPNSPVKYGTSVAAAYSEVIIPEFLTRLWAYGGSVCNSSNKVVFNSKESVKAITAFCKTFEFTHPNSLNQDIERTVSDFYEGNTAMLIGYSSYSTAINERFTSKIVGKIGYDYIPGKSPILGGWSLGLNPNSRKKELAFRFINWACGTDICNYCAILEGQSTLIDVYNNDELLKLYPWLTLQLDTFKYCRMRKGPYTPGGKVIPQDRIELLIAKAIYSILKKESTIEQALTVAQYELTLLFDSFGYRQD